jgi:hypothetical protein
MIEYSGEGNCRTLQTRRVIFLSVKLINTVFHNWNISNCDKSQRN